MALVAISQDSIDTYDTTFIDMYEPIEYNDIEWYISSQEMPIPKATNNAPNIGRTVAIMKKRVVKRGDTAIIIVERNKDSIIGLRKEKFSATFGTIEEIQRGAITNIRVAMPIGPEPGNKYAFLHAQKNVCARVVPDEETPRARWYNPVLGKHEEMTIEVIFNPLGIPSRMTMGLPYEMFFTGTVDYLNDTPVDEDDPKGMSLYNLYREDRYAFDELMYDRYEVDEASTLLDEITDSTPFVYNNIEKKERCRQLREKLGIPDEAMYDVFYPDGRKIEGKVFAGTAYYVKLRHLVDNKRRARGYVGRRDPLTGQPVKGRRKNGGANTGTMEADVYKAHGSRSMLWERMNKVSDGRIVYKCSQCGGLVSKTGTRELGFVYKCMDHDGTLLPELVYEVSTVQSWELFRYYLRALGIAITESFRPAQ
jgi:DNA-directed RNA polymerase beta subunit